MSSPSTARPLSAQDKAMYLRSLPDGAKRVQVRDAKGKTCWRKLGEVKDQDVLMFGNDGKPVIMTGEPGRRPKIALTAATEEVAEVMEAKADHLRDDELVSAVATDPTSDGSLDLIMRELAREAASLEFERKEAERVGNDTSSISVKRSRILSNLGDMAVKRREKLSESAFNLDSSSAVAYTVFVMETVREAMLECGVRREQVETIFGRLGKVMDESWKSEAKVKMREAKK